MLSLKSFIFSFAGFGSGTATTDAFSLSSRNFFGRRALCPANRLHTSATSLSYDDGQADKAIVYLAGVSRDDRDYENMKLSLFNRRFGFC